ncbi:MAG: glycerophosphodiester phosphodiesterase family protein [Rikenellaceae bacterium]
MKNLLVTLALLVAAMTTLSAQTQVIAHRGYWNCEGSAQNSIASLRNSAKIGVYGSEFDVVMTKDGVLVVNHDDDINGIDIQGVDYAEIKKQKITNGEQLPTLAHYLKEGQKHPKLKLILEMKPHRTEEQEDQAVARCMELVKKYGVESQTEFISFSMNICEEFALVTESPVSYLNGEVAPAEITKNGIDGVDYHYEVYGAEANWIAEAEAKGVITNSWTINDLDVASSLISQGIDYLTTDYPEEIATLVERQK